MEIFCKAFLNQLVWQQDLSLLGTGSQLHSVAVAGGDKLCGTSHTFTHCLFVCERIVFWNCRENTLSVGKNKTDWPLKKRAKERLSAALTFPTTVPA